MNHTYFYVKGYNIHKNSVNNTNISIGLIKILFYLSITSTTRRCIEKQHPQEHLIVTSIRIFQPITS